MIAESVPNFVGGSADLDPSTRTMMKGKGDFQSPQVAEGGQTPPTQGAAGGEWGYAGRNVHFGIREHAMTAILTGMAHHGGVVPFGATFLTFSDYMRPSIRLAALSEAHVIYVWTHDSIALGEDGPTHQPVEQIASLRAMPNMLVIRPADATETIEAWRIAISTSRRASGLVLTRQKLPVLDRACSLPRVRRRAARTCSSTRIPAACRSSFSSRRGPRCRLRSQRTSSCAATACAARVVSMPSWELFESQPNELPRCGAAAGGGARV